MTPKLYRAGEVCELVQVQPYVLRSWEKEFPGIGTQKSVDGPRLYSETDLESVNRIKHLVFVEGLTVAGARRKLESAGTVAPVPPPAPRPVAVAPKADAVVAEAAPVANGAPAAKATESRPAVTSGGLLDGIGPEAKVRVAAVREHLQGLQAMLAGRPGEKGSVTPPAVTRARRRAPADDAQPEMFGSLVLDGAAEGSANGESGGELATERVSRPVEKKTAESSRRRRATA